MHAPRVLIVEGSRAGTAALSAALAREGHATHCVRRRADGLRAALSGAPPDLVVVGGHLPDGDAVDVVRALKARLHPAFVPVVVVAADAAADARVAALRAGADDCLAGPFEPAELSARAASLLRIKASLDALRAEKEELERLSVTDALTGLFNRRYFQYRLAQEVERARRHGGALSLLLLDLDHFKRVNDRLGHAAGDAVLRGVADVVKGELRRVDVCTRWGGEELAVVMPSTDRAGAAVVAERVLRALRAHVHACVGPDGAPSPLTVTASAGLAVFPAPDVDGADELLRRADAALYRAKEQGRDRACAAWDPAPERAGRAAPLFARPACA